MHKASVKNNTLFHRHGLVNSSILEMVKHFVTAAPSQYKMLSRILYQKHITLVSTLNKCCARPGRKLHCLFAM